MNKVDIVRNHIGNDDFYDINGTSILTNILNAMEEYKEQEVKNCSIPDVVWQSEQLKCDNCKCTPTVIHNTPSGRFCEDCRPVTL